MDIPSSCQRKPRLVFTCCSAWLLLLITHKFLELSRVYGYLDILISFHWHFLHFQRTCLPQVVVFWFGATALLLWQGQQTGSPAASRAARPAELRGLDAINVFVQHTKHPVWPKGWCRQLGFPKHAVWLPEHADPSLGMPARRMVLSP